MDRVDLEDVAKKIERSAHRRALVIAGMVTVILYIFIAFVIHHVHAPIMFMTMGVGFLVYLWQYWEYRYVGFYGVMDSIKKARLDEATFMLNHQLRRLERLEMALNPDPETIQEKE